MRTGGAQGGGWAAASDPPSQSRRHPAALARVPGEAPGDGLRGGHSGCHPEAALGGLLSPLSSGSILREGPDGLAGPFLQKHQWGSARGWGEQKVRGSVAGRPGAADGGRAGTWSPWARLCAHMRTSACQRASRAGGSPQENSVERARPAWKSRAGHRAGKSPEPGCATTEARETGSCRVPRRPRA